jgi:hypothetical protein
MTIFLLFRAGLITEIIAFCQNQMLTDVRQFGVLVKKYLDFKC